LRLAPSERSFGALVGIALLYTTRIEGNERYALSDEDFGLIAIADDGTYPHNIVLAAWEELAARGVVVEFIEQQEVPSETPDLVTVATFRNYVQAQFTQSRLLSSGMPSFLFDDNTIRIDCSCPQHSVASNCACPPAIHWRRWRFLGSLDTSHRAGRS